MLLDTNFLIDYIDEIVAGRSGPTRRFIGTHRNQPMLISAIALGEVAAGMRDNQMARNFFYRVGFRILSVFPELALHAAALDRQLMTLGQRLGENDNWLAGTALYYGQPLVSNDGDFDRVPGLRVITY